MLVIGLGQYLVRRPRSSRSLSLTRRYRTCTTADKRLRFTSPLSACGHALAGRLPLATSFVSDSLSAILDDID